MADEPTKKTEEEIQPEATVTLSQDKLDSLINDKFKKGAEKANAKILEELGVDNLDALKEIVQAKSDAEEAQKTELQKAQDAAEAAKLVNDELINRTQKLENENKVNLLAVKHGIKDAEYLGFKYNKAQSAEDFNEEAFIEEFKKGQPTVTVTTDKTPNNSNTPGTTDLGKMSYRELQEYQKTL